MKYQGRAFIRINGAEYPSNEGSTLTLGGYTRATVKGQRVYGYQETATESTVDVKIPNGKGIDPMAIKDMTDATIEFQTDIGQTYLLVNAWCVDDVTLTDKGEISAKFAAAECKAI